MAVYQKGLQCVSLSIHYHHHSVIQHDRGDKKCRRSSFLLFENLPSSLSGLIFDGVIPSSLQCPLDSRHHGGAIGAGQYSQLRCSLKFGQ
jgi:hypothetical protein